MNPYIEQANQQFVPVYNRYPIVWDHGEGMYLYDTEGKRYLDFGSGIGVCALGYHDPNYTRALQEQMEKLLHTSRGCAQRSPPAALSRRFSPCPAGRWPQRTGCPDPSSR